MKKKVDDLNVSSCHKEEEMCKHAIIVGREADKSEIRKRCLVHIFITDYGGKIEHNILFSASSRRYLQCKHSRDSLLGLCLYRHCKLCCFCTYCQTQAQPDI